jgi:hypothetical protein
VSSAFLIVSNIPLLFFGILMKLVNIEISDVFIGGKRTIRPVLVYNPSTFGGALAQHPSPTLKKCAITRIYLERVIGFEPTTSHLAIVKVDISPVSLGIVRCASNRTAPMGFRRRRGRA